MNSQNTASRPDKATTHKCAKRAFVGYRQTLRRKNTRKIRAGDAQETRDSPLAAPSSTSLNSPQSRRFSGWHRHVTLAQHIRSDLELYEHLHCPVTDGASQECGEQLYFGATPPPTLLRLGGLPTTVEVQRFAATRASRSISIVS